MRRAARLAGGVLLALVCALAQCPVERAGRPNPNVNRPVDEDTPAAGFSPLGPLNQGLPRWLCFTAGYRARWEGPSGAGFEPGSDGYALTRFRLGTLIRPVAWLKVYAELQDARVFGQAPPLGPPNQSTWDLRRAYVDVGDVEESRVAIRAGRQDLNFGYGRLVGTSYWRNASRGFDAALLTVRWDWLSVRAFSASQVVASINGLSHHEQGNKLHGIYGGLKNRIPNSVIEPYVFWRVAPRVRTESGAPGKLDEKVAGMRLAGAWSRLDYDAEITGETGQAGHDEIRAWAWSAIAGYTLASVPLRPRLFVEYDFASGDHNPTDGRRGTFDQLYPNIHAHHGLADQVGWQNLKEVRAGARVSVRRNWTASMIFSDWRLADARDAFYTASGAVFARDPEGRSGTHIGTEWDLETSWRLNRDLELGAGVGYVRPGRFLAEMHRGHAYMYPFVMLNYNLY